MKKIIASFFSLAEAKHLIKLGLPVYVAQMGNMGMNFIDTAMTGQASATDMAAVAVASSLWLPVSIFGVGVLVVLSPLIAQKVGAGERAQAPHLLRQGIWCALLLCLPLMLLLYFLSWNMHLFGLEPALALLGGGYMRAILWGLPGLLLFVCARGFLEGFSRTRPAMMVALLGLLLNIPSNYVLIYGKLGLPALGAVGCGIATALCFWFMAFCTFYYARKDDAARNLGPLFSPLWRGQGIARRRVAAGAGADKAAAGATSVAEGTSGGTSASPTAGAASLDAADCTRRAAGGTASGGIASGVPPLCPRVDWPCIRRIFRIGLPGALALLFEVSLFAVTALLLAPMGTVTVAGHQIALNVSSILFVVPMSLGMTITIRVGHCAGAGQWTHARLAAWTAMVLAVGLNVCSVALVALFRENVVLVYNNDPQVLQLASVLLLYAAAFQVVDAVQAIGVGILRGYNDTRVISIVCFTAYWVISLPLGFVLARTNLLGEPWGAAGFWLAYLVGLGFGGLCYLTRVVYLQKQSGAWLKANLHR